MKNQATPTLRNRLMRLMLAVSLVPIILIGMFSICCILYFGMQEKVNYERANLQSTVSEINSALQEVRYTGIDLSQNSIILEYLEKGYSNPNYYPSSEELFKVKTVLSSVVNVGSMHSAYIYDVNGNTYTSQPAVLVPYEQIVEYSWFQKAIESSSNYFWGDPMYINRAWVIPYVRRITDISNQKVLGYIVINMYEDVLCSAYSQYGDVYIINDDSVIISAEDKSILGLELSNVAENAEYVSLADSRYANWKQVFSRDILMYYDNSIGNPSAVKILHNTTSKIISDMMLLISAVLVISVGLCILLSSRLSKRFINPLMKMKANVDILQLDYLQTNLHPKSNDEIGMLMDSFNNMSTRLKESVEEITRINDARRKAEYRAIELQINPHFLYNTLSSIIWFADTGEVEKVKSVASALSTLFRISVNRGKELVRISEEIQHLRCYMDILSIRHQGEFHYQLDIDPAVMEYYTIKILLQPLVENSIQHGIRENMILDGFIRVTAGIVGSRIIFEVIDNGNISQKQIDELNNILNSDQNADMGIGVLNVHNRIRYYFKEDYGLQYMKRDEYTVAHIEIPILEGDFYV